MPRPTIHTWSAALRCGSLGLEHGRQPCVVWLSLSTARIPMAAASHDMVMNMTSRLAQVGRMQRRDLVHLLFKLLAEVLVCAKSAEPEASANTIGSN